MLGFRGASRYCSDRYREAFGLECQAVQLVRDGMGLTNVVPMIPFCRRVEEAAKVLEVMAMSVQRCRRNGWHSGICGQAPSDYPEIAELLVREGIDPISVDPDLLMAVTLRVLRTEDRRSKGGP